MAEATKRRLRSESHVGGLEGVLDTMAHLVLWVGIAAALILLLALANEGGMLVALGTAFNAVLGWLLLRSLAEIIRLLKKSAGVPYGGKISTVQRIAIYECVGCGALLHDENRCESCGREIDGDAVTN